MSFEQFAVQSAIPTVINVVTIVLITLGAVLLASGRLLRNKLKTRVSFSVTGLLGRKHSLAFIGVFLIIFGGFIYGVSYAGVSPSVVTIGSGYISVAGNAFSTIGNINVTSSEIASAFVGQVGSGDFTLHKQTGTNFGDTNMGTYTLGNGAKATVISNNSTNLIIQLNNGEYLIIGTTNTQPIAECFSQNVYQLTPQQ